jgi:hypothetical protein
MFSIMILDGRRFCFTSAAIIRQLLELLLNEIKEGRKGMSVEGTKEIIPY